MMAEVLERNNLGITTQDPLTICSISYLAYTLPLLCIVKPLLPGQQGTRGPEGAHNLEMPITEKHVYCV